MLIREDVEYTYFNSLNNNITERTILRCEIKCDNPECGKTSYRRKSQAKPSKLHYCNIKCRSMHFDICKIDGCKEKISYQSNKSGVCNKHHDMYNWKTAKSKLLELMGGACICCDERDPMFLQVDHVFNDGHIDRKKRNLKIKDYLKIWNETPERIQLLCANCNHAKAKNGGVIYRPEKFTRRKVQREKIGECTC
jgi:hypothetical protein|tara:strand:+ start:864 stop:1448 length:585 start_codon:yes stop_codon:yes gene_type:complete